MSTPNELLTLLAVAPSSTEEAVLKLLIQLGAQVVGAAEGSLLVYDKAQNDLVFVMTVGGSQQLIGQRVPMSKGLTGLAAATREVQIGAPTFTGVQQAAGPEAVIAAPMLINDDLVGVITAVTFEKGKRFSANDGDLYGRLATVAGVVVEQRQRINAALAGAEKKIETQASSTEQQLAASIAKISKKPGALEKLAAIVKSVESLVAPEDGIS